MFFCADLHQRRILGLGPLGIVLGDVSPDPASRCGPLEARHVDLGRWAVGALLLAQVGQSVEETHRAWTTADESDVEGAGGGGATALAFAKTEHHCCC